MNKIADKIMILLLKLLILIFIIPISLGIVAISKPLQLRITQIMEKFGREDVVKVLLMSGFTGLLKLLLGNY
ncbi:MAG: hypothetical protein ACTSRP_06545 [Candidatus Helarchaeota archaeon]